MCALEPYAVDDLLRKRRRTPGQTTDRRRSAAALEVFPQEALELRDRDQTLTHGVFTVSIAGTTLRSTVEMLTPMRGRSPRQKPVALASSAFVVRLRAVRSARSTRGRLIAGVGVSCAVLSWVFGLWCNVNGPNYDGWVRTFGTFSWIALVATVIALIARPKLTPHRLAMAVVGWLVTAISIGITIARYGDGRPLSDVPGVLAWISLAALTVAAAAVSVPIPSRRRSSA